MASTRPAARVGRVSRFGREVRRRRQQVNLTQSELASMLGVQTQTVSQWERGETKPQPRHFDKLADFLKLRDRAEVRSLLASVDLLDAGLGFAVVRELNPSPGNRSMVADSAESIGDSDGRDAMRLALAIIDKRQGDLSTVEAEIVQALLRVAQA